MLTINANNTTYHILDKFETIDEPIDKIIQKERSNCFSKFDDKFMIIKYVQSRFHYELNEQQMKDIMLAIEQAIETPFDRDIYEPLITSIKSNYQGKFMVNDFYIIFIELESIISGIIKVAI